MSALPPPLFLVAGGRRRHGDGAACRSEWTRRRHLVGLRNTEKQRGMKERLCPASALSLEGEGGNSRTGVAATAEAKGFAAFVARAGHQRGV